MIRIRNRFLNILPVFFQVKFRTFSCWPMTWASFHPQSRSWILWVGWAYNNHMVMHSPALSSLQYSNTEVSISRGRAVFAPKQDKYPGSPLVIRALSLPVLSLSCEPCRWQLAVLQLTLFLVYMSLIVPGVAINAHFPGAVQSRSHHQVMRWNKISPP